MKNDTINCWHCGTALQKLGSSRKISFRLTCDKCHAWLHCCKNCVNYKPGLPNDCLIPGTDPITDREAGNYCEEFVVRGIGPAQAKNLSDVSIRLFGDEEIPQKQNPRDAFGSLFKDG